MTTVGRAFGFYIKYWHEMQAVYEDKTPLGVTSKADTPAMIKRVGDRASEQAAKLLEKCGIEIDKYFSKTPACRAKVRSRFTFMKKYWEIQIRLRRTDNRKTAKLLWFTGATIDKSHDDREPALFLWMWVGGSNRQGRGQAEEDLAKLLGETRVRARAVELSWSKGTVAFGKIRLERR
jgi:hypothetical protein